MLGIEYRGYSIHILLLMIVVDVMFDVDRVVDGMIVNKGTIYIVYHTLYT